MPKTVTIPRELAKEDDLVVIPRKEYEALLRLKEESIAEERKKHPEFYAQLDRDLREALEEYERGEAIGPFESAEELMRSLKSRTPKQKR